MALFDNNSTESGLIRVTIVRPYTSGAIDMSTGYIRAAEIIYVIEAAKNSISINPSIPIEEMTEEEREQHFLMKTQINANQPTTEIMLRGMNGPLLVMEPMNEIMKCIKFAEMGM